MGKLIDEDDAIRIVGFECGEWIGLARTIINSIKKIPCSATDTKVVDTISRQAAIDIIEDFPHGGVWNVESMEEMVYRIKQLPPAQPEVIRCKECKHLHKWRSEESAKKFGQIYTCAKDVLNCPKPEDFCSRPERKQDG